MLSMDPTKKSSVLFLGFFFFFFCDFLFANVWTSLGIEGIWAFLLNTLNTWCRGCKNILCCNSPNFWWVLIRFKLAINLVIFKILKTRRFFLQGLYSYWGETNVIKLDIFGHLSRNSNFHNLKWKTIMCFFNMTTFSEKSSVFALLLH